MRFAYVRAVHASNVLSAGREPQWLRLSRAAERVRGDSGDATILSSICETVWRRTMTGKEKGPE